MAIYYAVGAQNAPQHISRGRDSPAAHKPQPQHQHLDLASLNGSVLPNARSIKDGRLLHRSSCHRSSRSTRYILASRVLRRVSHRTSETPWLPPQDRDDTETWGTLLRLVCLASATSKTSRCCLPVCLDANLRTASFCASNLVRCSRRRRSKSLSQGRITYDPTQCPDQCPGSSQMHRVNGTSQGTY